jgi:uncharacterized membrane protein
MPSISQTGKLTSLVANQADSASNPSRLDSVDALRGLVMVIMALDHTRDFFSKDLVFDPTDLGRTYPALFLTRWITHFCAPVFIFLAGTGAFLSTTRGKSRKELSWFLLTRGLWLVFLELTWVRCLGWQFNFDFHYSMGIVIWAIGWSMVALAGLIFLPLRWVTTFGLLMIASHNLFDYIKPQSWGPLGWLWKILHSGGEIAPVDGCRFAAGYPLIPWIGVMAAGYGFGRLLLREPAERRKWLWVLGASLTASFVLLRVLNVYGDPGPWSWQRNGLFTLFSFLNCHKYPPSLLYLLMTLGPALLVLAALDGGTPRWLKPVLVFGRVPLFYYLLHLPLIHALAVLASYLHYGRADWWFANPPESPDAPSLRPSDYGYALPIVYLVWLGVVLALYPICRWFAELKRRRREPWLSYL